MNFIDAMVNAGMDRLEGQLRQARQQRDELLAACEAALNYTMTGHADARAQREAEYKLSELLAAAIAKARGEA